MLYFLKYKEKGNPKQTQCTPNSVHCKFSGNVWSSIYKSIKRIRIFLNFYNFLHPIHMTEKVRRVSRLRREPVVSVKNPTLIPTSHWKRWSRSCRIRLRPSRCEFYAGVLCTELATRGSESATKGSVSPFSVWCWNQCGVLHKDYRFPT